MEEENNKRKPEPGSNRYNGKRKGKESAADFSDKNISDDEYFDSLPVGYRFAPSDYELIAHYLFNKVNGRPLPRNRIREVELFNQSPQQLTEQYKLKEDRETEWYFFSARYKKYPKGQRPDRKAGEGYWKPTGVDKAIPNPAKCIGTRRWLDYYEGKPPNGRKTNWKMHEYVIIDKYVPPPGTVSSINDRGKRKVKEQEKDIEIQKLNDWVLYKIYNKKIHNKKDKNFEDGEISDSSSMVQVTEANHFTSQPQNNTSPPEPFINPTNTQENYSMRFSPHTSTFSSLDWSSLPFAPPPPQFLGWSSLPPPTPHPPPPPPPPPPPSCNMFSSFAYDMPIQSYDPSSYSFQPFCGCTNPDCYGSCMEMVAANKNINHVVVPEELAVPLLQPDAYGNTYIEMDNDETIHDQPNSSKLVPMKFDEKAENLLTMPKSDSSDKPKKDGDCQYFLDPFL